MKKLNTADRVRVVAALVEGCSVRATCRMTGVALNTVLKLVLDLGEACQAFHDAKVVNLEAVERVQADEIWCFVGAKEKNTPPSQRGTAERGSAWTWKGICKDTKLMISWYVGPRDADSAGFFMADLASRLPNRVQLTTDGLAVYERAVESAFGWLGVDYAQLIKTYGAAPADEARYSPAVCTGCHKVTVMGAPVTEDICTSHIERSNLTLRMQQRRYTRLTNAFSKKLINLRAAAAIHFVHYNFCRIHKTLRVTPAMEAGLTKHLWSLEELVGILEHLEAKRIEAGSMKRGPYRKGGDSN